MDSIKCQALKNRLGSELYGQTIPVEEFFDGNDDLGSIGCNLDPHPGVDAFRNFLTGLLGRPDERLLDEDDETSAPMVQWRDASTPGSRRYSARVFEIDTQSYRLRVGRARGAGDRDPQPP